MEAAWSVARDGSGRVMPEAGSRKPEAGSRKPEAGSHDCVPAPGTHLSYTA